MIPASHWHDNGNGTAWWVTDIETAWHRAKRIDRPCDTCDGTGLEAPTLRFNGGKPAHFQSDCPNCIGGRHTWEIEVEAPEGRGDMFPDPGWFSTHCVSVVPGMVLPLVLHYPGSGTSLVKLSPSTTGQDYCIVTPKTQPGRAKLVRIPPAAEPEMWAVLLNIEAV